MRVKLGQISSLEDQVLAHVNSEQFMLEKNEDIQLTVLNTLLEEYGLKANDAISNIRFAQNCYFVLL